MLPHYFMIKNFVNDKAILMRLLAVTHDSKCMSVCR